MLISVEVEKKGGRLLVGGKLYEEVAGLFVVNMKHSLQTVCFFIKTDGLIKKKKTPSHLTHR